MSYEERKELAKKILDEISVEFLGDQTKLLILISYISSIRYDAEIELSKLIKDSIDRINKPRGL